MLEFYTNFYLPEMILAKADRASIRASLGEPRPILGPCVAAFCQRLQHGYKLRNGQRKFILKEALRGLVPDVVLQRKKRLRNPAAGLAGQLAASGRHAPWLCRRALAGLSRQNR
jgi:asparagine synthetase B (glutamine-hydrolysing)